MKFTVHKSTFMNKLTPAMGTVSNKNTITSIEGVLIETLDGGKVRISTYDMNKGYRAQIEPVSIEREGRFIINAQRLYQTVRVLPDDEITIDMERLLDELRQTKEENSRLVAELERHLGTEPAIKVVGDITDNRTELQEVYDNREYL